MYPLWILSSLLVMPNNARATLQLHLLLAPSDGAQKWVELQRNHGDLLDVQQGGKIGQDGERWGKMGNDGETWGIKRGACCSCMFALLLYVAHSSVLRSKTSSKGWGCAGMLSFAVSSVATTELFVTHKGIKYIPSQSIKEMYAPCALHL